jgi:hypothetical protein
MAKKLPFVLKTKIDCVLVSNEIQNFEACSNEVHKISVQDMCNK